MWGEEPSWEHEHEEWDAENGMEEGRHVRKKTEDEVEEDVTREGVMREGEGAIEKASVEKDAEEKPA